MNISRKWRIKLLKWHRRIGIIAAIGAIIISATGIMINHAHDLEWDRQIMPNWALLFYGMPSNAQPMGIFLPPDWWYIANNQLYKNQKPIAHCPSPLKGMVKQNQLWVAACNNQIHLFIDTSEQLDYKNYGQPIDQLGLTAKNKVMFKQEKTLFILDTDSMAPIPSSSQPPTNWSALRPLPSSFSKPSTSAQHIDSMTRERLLIDIHSGRLFGMAGKLVVDALAILITWLALSGTLLWARRTRILKK